jgi:hypothetical protein
VLWSEIYVAVFIAAFVVVPDAGNAQPFFYKKLAEQRIFAATSSTERPKVAIAWFLATALAAVIYFVPMTRFIDNLSNRATLVTAAE